MADFTDKTHNLADLSGKTSIFPDDNGKFDYEPPWVLIPHNRKRKPLYHLIFLYEIDF